MALFNAIARNVRSLLKAQPARRTPQLSSLRQNVETMEQRALLTGVGVVFSDGILEIDGTSGNDNVCVEIRQNYGYGTNNDFVMVKSNGHVIASGFVNADHPMNGGKVLKQIIFNGGEGDDEFTNNTWIQCLAWGEGGNDKLVGGSGNDIMMGGTGHDILLGRDGCDKLFGESGNDLLSGGDGDDRLEGGYGEDCLYGGYGNDDLFGGWGYDNLYGGSGSDRLFDFDFHNFNHDGPNSPS